MELLPSSHEEFSQPDYWDRFFKKRGNIPFEWYGEYPELHGVIHKYIMPANRVLVIGCGNSSLSENMYDNGLQNLVNIDISEVVVRQMADRHREKRPNMTFEAMDVTRMSYTDGAFGVALDKGTLDALLVSEEGEVVGRVRRMFDEVCRTLALGGRYIVISLLQDHVQKTLLEYFTGLKWPIRIHKIDMESDSEKGDNSSSSPLPVFAVVITKLKVLPNLPQIVEVVRFEDQIDRLEDVKYLPGILKDIQYYNTVRHRLKKSSPEEKQISLELHSKDFDTPRYTLVVVDSPTPIKNKFAIFIVPQGREHEWLFSTDKGRLHLLENAQFQRLVVVSLSRGHEYENLEAIKAELSRKVMELAPRDQPAKNQIPFLSIGEDIGKRLPVAQGHSDTTGPYLVEDVEMNGGQVFRRLVFVANQNVIQTEAKMSESRRAKRRGKKPLCEGMPTNMRVDKGYLPSDYTIAMLGGFSFLPSLDEPVSGVIVGLGGGGMSSFLHGVFPKLVINTVEIDPTVVDIARNWFGLECDENLRVHVADGISYIQDLITQGTKVDFVAVDVDSKDNSTGLVCPAPPFVEYSFLTAVFSVLSDHGVFILNLASRDDGLKQQLLDRIRNKFPTLATIQLQEDINCIVVASKQPPTHPDFDPERLRHVHTQMDSKMKAAWKTTNVNLEDMMEQLTFCQ